MGFAENMRIMSDINCALASGVTYMEQKQNGVPGCYAMKNLFGNLTNGFMRNEIAYGMQRCGNPVGNNINLYAGYGNPVSNTIGTLGILGACTPWMFFNQPSYMFCCPNFGFYSGMGMGFGGSFSITTTTTYGGFRPRAYSC
ncbi:MAG: hypothetical protein NC191_09355 [Muribaculaceae bacterium]|nr:hypothetical protein [Muribaculaceae bacterium]